MALCLDLTLRREGTGSLDEVMRRLWRESEGGPIDEAAIAAALEAVGRRSYVGELSRWANGTDELPLRELLEAHGVAVHEDPAQLAQALGLRVDESGGIVKVKMVLRGAAAEKAGFAAGDEWLAVEIPCSTGELVGWRLTKMEDIRFYLGDARMYIALLSRECRLVRASLSLPAHSSGTWRLVSQNGSATNHWLN